MICIYHNDMDGKCSAAVVRKAYPNKEIKFIESNYNRPFPWSDIKGEDVVMVDFTVQPYKEMTKIQDEAKSFVWIDHHSSAIKAVKDLGIEVDGLQEAHTGAGCELAWEYYFKDVEIPIAIQYIGDYDTWKFAFGEKTKRFGSGLWIQNTDPTSKLWHFLFNDMRDDELIRSIMRDGDVINLYNESMWKSRVKSGTFEIEMDGKKGLACNYWGSGSNLFKSIPNLYDIYDFVAVFSWNGKVWTISLYTERKDVDVSTLAVARGGGGHFGAAGYTSVDVPFKGVYNES